MDTKSKWRFGAVEVLIVVSIVYAMAWKLGPGIDLYLPPRGPCSGGMQSARQKRTVADVENTAAAITRWSVATQTDQSLLAGERRARDRVGLSGLRRVSHAALVEYLQPQGRPLFLQDVPLVDGWKNEIEYYFDGTAIPPRRFLIRSAGCRGRFEGTVYVVGPFDPTAYDQDIVWADGQFVRWPSKVEARSP